MSHLDTVRAIYGAFGRGDVATILEHVSEDVAWEFAYASDIPIPWLVPGRGRAHVGNFFRLAAEHLDFKRFEVPHLLADGNLVVALASLEAVVKSTGKTLREEQEAHVWHFDSHGKVIRFRHAADTLQHWRALQR
jgi:ketosteroid isomerase-like protein